MTVPETIPFGVLLKQLRKRAGMTQRDLAAALNYSDALISNLEHGQRLPDVDAVVTRFIPALGLQEEPDMAVSLIERAAAARGERLRDLPEALANSELSKRNTMGARGDEQSGRLPLPLTELIGRSEEVDRLCNRLLGHSGRLLTLVGPPGIGKTRLALAVAEQIQHHYVDGAVLVALAEITDGEVMASTIVAILGWNDNSPKSPRTKLIECLRRKTMLLILDNCEQIVDAALIVAEILSGCPGIVVLATSRERLHLRAEQRYRVPPLTLADAVELFSQRATAVDDEFLLTAVNRPTIEAICEKLDRLPLALELCAAQIDFLSPAQLLEQLQNRRLDLLVDGAHDLPSQHRTLRHAIQRSYDLLSAEQRRLFRSLGIFVGGFALPEFEALGTWERETSTGNSEESSSALSALHALVGKSLVRVEMLPSGEQRYLLLEMIREFAVEQLRAQDEEVDLRQRHYAAYLHFARKGDSHLSGPEAATWLARMQTEYDNLRASMSWLLDEARYEDTAWLGLALFRFWDESEYSYEAYEGAQWLAQLLPYRHTFSDDLRLAILLSYSAVTAHFLKDFEPVERYVDELMQLVESDAHPLLRALTLMVLPEISADINRTAALEQAILLARAAGESPELGAEFCGIANQPLSVLAKTLWAFAHCLTEQGKVAQAIPIIMESRKIFVARGQHAMVGHSDGILGQLALLRGDLVQAKALLHDVISVVRKLNIKWMLCEWQPLLGLVLLYEGDVDGARHLLHESLQLNLEVNNRILLKWVCTYLAELALWEGKGDEAEDWLTQSMAYHGELLRVTIYEVRRLFHFARVATAQQQYARAALLFGLAEEAHCQIDQIFYRGPMRSQIEVALATTRAALGEKLFDAEFAAGRSFPLAEAYHTLLTPAKKRSPLT